ncbi:MAG: sulfatase-like hydrolase/transferase [Thermodesulfobacteriota bacterium]
MQNVLLITIDSLRADAVGALSGRTGPDSPTPSLDRLIAEGAVFTRAFSQGGTTQTSFPALLSGQYLCRHRDAYKGLSADRPLLSEAFAAAGARTCAFNSNPYISRHLNYHRGFSDFYDNLPASPRSGFFHRANIAYQKARALFVAPYVPANQLNRQVFSWLDRAPRPFFLWVHYMDVHGPYVPVSGFAPLSRLRAGFLWKKANHRPAEVSGTEKQALYADYRDKVRFCDGHAGELLHRLAGPDTLTVLTADHGDLFGEKGIFAHPPRVLYDKLLHVPLVFHQPGTVSPARYDAPVSLLSLAPTILDLAGLSPVPPAPLDGTSLAPGMAGGQNPTARDMIHESWTKVLAVRRHPYKLIADFTKNRFELYDTRNDPDETTDLAPQRPDLVEEMTQTARQHLLDVNASAEDLEAAGYTPDSAVAIQLKSLGYL